MANVNQVGASGTVNKVGSSQSNGGPKTTWGLSAAKHAGPKLAERFPNVSTAARNCANCKTG